MGLSYSTDKTDQTGKELLTYGTPDFPIAFFDDDLTKVRVPWHWLKRPGFPGPTRKRIMPLQSVSH